jgi:hypothetical protein
MDARIMPPRRTRVTGATPPDDDTQPAAVHQGILTDDLAPDVERVLAELGENASTVTIYRMDDTKPGKWDFLARYTAPEFSIERVKEQFGGGEYRAIIVDATQGPLNAAYFSIDSRFTGKLFANTPALHGAVASGDAFKDKLLEVLLLKALTPPPAPPPRDDLDMVLKVAQIFKGGDSGNVSEQVNNMIQTAVTLAQSMNPPEGLAGLAGSFLPVINKLIPDTPAEPAARRVLPARVPTATPSLTVQQPPAPAPAPNPPARVAGSIAPSWLAPFRSFAGALTMLADTGSDPTTYADVVLDYLQGHEDTFAAAAQAMLDGTMLADVYKLAPAMQLSEPRKNFAIALVDAVESGLRDIIDNAPDDDEQAEPPTAEAVTNG